MAQIKLSADQELAQMLRPYRQDPLGFVRIAYPWGTGVLAGVDGPDKPQTEFLRDLGRLVKDRNFAFGADAPEPAEPIKMAMSKGHGTGGSTMTAWLADWIMSTWPGSIGTVTAGTAVQLEERTWAAVRTWTDLCITGHWFDVQSNGMYAKPFICGAGVTPDSWKVLAFTCKSENYQSFAGQHARTSASWYQFDEASEVPDNIWDTATGGLTDGQPMFFAWGQCVRNTGRFYEVCFGSHSPYWDTRTIDSRESRWPNKPEIQKWSEQYGEDSDYFRVRVRGLAPSASELQYIDRQRVNEARKRPGHPLMNEPLIAGFDVSGGGKAWNVIRFRRGTSMRVKDAIRIPGEHDPDRGQRVAICCELLADQRPDHKLAAMFVDAAFGAAIVQHVRLLGYKNIYEVNFGSECPDPNHYANARAYMYGKLKDWLLTGSIPDEDDLAAQICLPGYHFRSGTSKLVLESKADIQKRGEKSPDDADACALTFARVVAPVDTRSKPAPRLPSGPNGWMG